MEVSIASTKAQFVDLVVELLGRAPFCIDNHQTNKNVPRYWRIRWLGFTSDA